MRRHFKVRKLWSLEYLSERITQTKDSSYINYLCCELWSGNWEELYFYRLLWGLWNMNNIVSSWGVWHYAQWTHGLLKMISYLPTMKMSLSTLTPNRRWNVLAFNLAVTGTSKTNTIYLISDAFFLSENFMILATP